jgi:Domain of unknown function (DUF5134)
VAGPDWLDGTFAAVMLVVAAYSAGRLVAAAAWSRPTHADVDTAHVLMGVGMAGMLSAALNPIPDGVWEVVFGAVVLWFVVRCWRFVTSHGLEGRDDDHVHHLSHYLTHLLMAGAMLYMEVVAVRGTGASRDAGMAMNGASGTAADLAFVPLLFVVVLFASAVWEVDGIQRFSPGAVDRPAPVAALAGRNGAGSAGALVVEELVGEEAVPDSRPWLAPRLEAACHVAMCVAMGYMLVLLL